MAEGKAPRKNRHRPLQHVQTSPMRFRHLLILLIAITFSEGSVAASTDDYLTCSLMYGALFQAAKDSDNSPMIAYTKPRLNAVIPFLEKNRNNPEVSERMKVIASRLEDDTKTLAKRATAAINESNNEKLKAALPQVFRCDAVFQLQSLPLPLSSTRPAPKTKFAEGFYSGCLAKQRQNPGPFRDAQIVHYCKCMTGKSVAKGMTAESTDDETASIVRSVHKDCVNQITR